MSTVKLVPVEQEGLRLEELTPGVVYRNNKHTELLYLAFRNLSTGKVDAVVLGKASAHVSIGHHHAGTARFSEAGHLETTEEEEAGLTMTGRMVSIPVEQKLPASESGLQLKKKPDDAGAYTGWKVQFNVAPACQAAGNWLVVSQLGLPRKTRNDAYRAMRARIKAQGAPAERYRVVPADHPEGPEKNRGYYQVEMQESGVWVYSYVIGPSKFATVAAAQARIDSIQKVNTLVTYRVKWHPNKSKS
jgi:hypothetical protein